MSKILPENYAFRGMILTEHDTGAIRRYLEHGIRPGSFTCAVINNDLEAACANADDYNIHLIPAYVAYLYNHAPAGTWGYPDAVQDHVERMEKLREEPGE